MSFDPHHDPTQRIEDKTNWLTVWNTATTEMDALEESVKDMQAAYPWPVL